ncbi:histidine protein methyltransferase 1 homolog [Hydra vulgaris]|uniref:histidine protein methyltransferase 1 homolog n=1 Tax=Hydra vulgaris TaxID=6087 RepID=UPI0032EA4681
MEIVSENCAYLSNMEVFQLLDKEKLVEHKHSNTATVAYQTLKYLEKTPCKAQNNDQVTNFLNAIQHYNFTKAEKLQLVNLRPTSIIEMQLIIEELDERLKTEEELENLIHIINRFFPESDSIKIMSFKFNFGESEQETAMPKITTNGMFRECREHYYKEHSQRFDDFKDLVVGDIQLFYLNPLIASNRVEEKELKSLLESSDLKAGTYEGGFKIWECTFDLIEYLKEHEKCMLNKSVLDLGCGSGLLGIFAFFSGAKKICLQDYNSEVIEEFTFPSVQQSLAKCGDEAFLQFEFYSGDWDNMCVYFSELKKERFDIILSSETIYTVEYYPKLLRVLEEQLTPNGVAYFAAKTHYFGVGGGTLNFIQFIRNNSKFFATTITTNNDGVCREIIKVSRLS